MWWLVVGQDATTTLEAMRWVDAMRRSAVVALWRLKRWWCCGKKGVVVEVRERVQDKASSSRGRSADKQGARALAPFTGPGTPSAAVQCCAVRRGSRWFMYDMQFPGVGGLAGGQMDERMNV